MSNGASRDWLERYLALLGIKAEPPSEKALRRLTNAHLRGVAFENVTSLLRRAATPSGPVPPMDHEAALSLWENAAGGGVCFDTTDMVLRLLRGLGYDAFPVLGQITFPGSHQAVVVLLGQERWLVDLGCGAPFFEPIPLNGEHEVHFAGLGYRFRPGEEPHTWMQDRQLGEWTPFCRYDLRPASDSEREAAYQRHHQPGESWVVGSFTLVRCLEDSLVQVRDGVLNRFTDAGKETQAIDDATTIRLVREVLRLPGLPVTEGLEARRSIAALVANSSGA
jgi:arylamine N-acetyltransferase